MKPPLPYLAVALIILAGCASGAGDLPVERPGIRIAQINTSEFIQERAGMFAVQYLLEIENTANVPITADWVELQTGAGGPYTIRQTTTQLKREVPANSIETVPISVWAYSYGGRTAAQEPVVLRLRVRFQSEKGSFQVREIARILQ